ncbi:NUDIX hydrolase [Pontibacter sp. BT310]|uniref:NUDIX hydrolase n=1 Tax=Pontibacter populi TaxID=890055 RepID=A0ABS6X7I1_9BACT|nr:MULTISPECIES: NUDIX hydrolase [Pontibacter]MBJ6117102.1 NUDIX hydrolase [Pontibacter sp. BT310]MBR0569526.1 NUDIX hydrolase [Microvirga sp. STS03]MBW3363955.1 NUDIX hydrolase [Pontibacter populi]
MEESIEPTGSNPKLPVVDQVSAGGVAYRKTGATIEVALISVGKENRWQLPKGIVDPGETPEVTAVREVREEAGLQTELLEQLEKIEYWYVGNKGSQRVRFHKFVYFYLLRYSSGNIQDHDWEVNEARWIEISQAQQLLAFKSEKLVVAKAANSIAQL